jgi:hypothetical protein
LQQKLDNLVRQRQAINVELQLLYQSKPLPPTRDSSNSPAYAAALAQYQRALDEWQEKANVLLRQKKKTESEINALQSTIKRYLEERNRATGDRQQRGRDGPESRHPSKH